jgi:16S rRNA (cytosine967-C5)-methyltransferase
VNKNPRLIAAKTLASLKTDGLTLSQLLPDALEKVAERDRSLVQELVYGTCRWYPQLKEIYLQLISKPLKAKDADLEALIFLGFYQLLHMRTAEHAAIHETVQCAKKLKKQWAVKFINALLRNFQREQAEMVAKACVKESARFAHPKWLIKGVKRSWPAQMEQILAANNQHPVFTLRVNLSKISRSDYLDQLNSAGFEATATRYSDAGVTLTQAVPVELLPNFEQGWVSVQDESAQLAAGLLNLAPGHRVLDACCAPGGKTGHIVEQEPDIQSLMAVDISERRLESVRNNLDRVYPDWQKTVVLKAADMGDAQLWNTDDQQFDRILLDAPCSATGVIRRHPDIKLLREPGQIEDLAQLQLKLLTNCWQALAPGGRLVYATCSIFPAENTKVIEQFIAITDDAQEIPIEAEWGLGQQCGRQILPQAGGQDGFYYAVISKC